jgi:hypothetical protein
MSINDYSCVFQTFDAATAGKLAGENPDYGIQSLFETIEARKYPSWTVYVVRILLLIIRLFINLSV